MMSIFPVLIIVVVAGVFYAGNKDATTQAQSSGTIVAQTLGAGKVGYNANVPGLHQPVALTNYNGSLTTTSNNQVIQNLNISGGIIVKHSNVKIINVKTKKISIDAKNFPNASADISWSTIGLETGLRISDDGHAAIGNGNLKLYRSEVFGAVDFVQLSCGSSSIVENWFHDLFDEPVDPGQGGGSSHPDPIQFVPSGYCTSTDRAIHDVVVTGNKFDSWTFKPGQSIGANWGNLNSDVATSGMTLIQTYAVAPAPRNISFTYNVVDGNYSYAWYSNVQSGVSAANAPQNLTVADNKFKKRYTNYGKQNYASVTVPPSGSPIQISHSRNTDLDTGATINVACGSSCTKAAPTSNPSSPPPVPPQPSPVPTPKPPTPTTPTPSPTTPSTPKTPSVPITVPGANPTTPVRIPANLTTEQNGTLIADFNGDGINEIARDDNHDGSIDPTTEVIAADVEEYMNELAATELEDSELQPTTNNPNTITFKAGPLPQVTIAKPVAYTFAIAQGVLLTGLAGYLAVTKLAIFAGIRTRLGL